MMPRDVTSSNNKYQPPLALWQRAPTNPTRKGCGCESEVLIQVPVLEEGSPFLALSTYFNAAFPSQPQGYSAE